jgi:hypothetical protein
LAIAHNQNVATYLSIFSINSIVQSTYPTICKKKKKPIINTDEELHKRKAKTYDTLAMTRHLYTGRRKSTETFPRFFPLHLSASSQARDILIAYLFPQQLQSITKCK